MTKALDWEHLYDNTYGALLVERRKNKDCGRCTFHYDRDDLQGIWIDLRDSIQSWYRATFFEQNHMKELDDGILTWTIEINGEAVADFYLFDKGIKPCYRDEWETEFLK